ncbi:alpha/beta fold hydrolase [Brachybacterium hainanense]|uniref:Alpha/beta fold hydrolase n=1 Tax=Brachybacterium hainanense TaxID=1541174 RepID=A0ABV6R9P0_9MICO
MDFVEMSDGARLATWTEPGPAGAPAVILVHGGPGLWDYLEPLGALLAGRATVHRYDQRGCGSSTRAPGVPDAEQLSMDRFVADLEELRIAFGHERIVLVGHSFGATLALAHAGAHPERVRGLAYVDGVGIGDWRAQYRPERARRLAPWAQERALLDALGAEGRSRAQETQWRRIQWAADYADPVAGYDLALPMAQSPHRIDQQVNRALMGWSDADQIGWAAAVTCPIFFVHGTADPRPVGPVMELAARARLPRKRAVTGAGHLPWIEQPEQVREILAELVVAAGARPV